MTPEDAPNPNRVLLDELHRLRGAFLSAMVDVEEALDNLILLYFRIPTEHRSDFTAWVLASMALGDKVDLVAKVTQTNRPGNTLKGIIAAIRRLKNYRNEVAHAGIGLHIGEGQTLGDAITDWRWASRRWTRSGAKSEVLTVEAMKDQILFAQYSSALLWTVMDEMAMAPNRVVPNDVDWRVRYNSSLNDRGIPIVSEELFHYLTGEGTEDGPAGPLPSES